MYRQEVSGMISVYLVDDHPLVREGLKTYLKLHDEIHVVGESSNGEDAIREMEREHPDIAVVDLSLPGMDGIQLASLVRQTCSGTQVIILSSFCSDEDVMKAIDAGVMGYLMKDSPPHKLIEALFTVNNGDPVLHPRIIKMLMGRPNRPHPLVEDLTVKEQEVLSELVKGKANKEIASELCISETTVKTHISRILRKMDVSDRTQAVIKAIEYNLISK